MTDKEAIKYLQQLYPNGGHCWLDEQRIEAIRMAVKALQEEPQVKKLEESQHEDKTCKENDNSLTQEPVSDFEMALTEMIDKAQKCVVEPWAVAAQWKDYLIELAKSEEPISEEWIEELTTKLDSMSKEDFKKVFDKYAVDFNEESVNEDLEKAANEWDAKASFTPFYMTLDDKGNPNGIKQDYTTHAESFKAGAKWQKQKDSMLVSEDLEKASYYFACKCHPLKTECSTSSPNPEVIEAFKAGAKWQREQMMRNIIDAQCFGFQGAALFSFRLPSDNYLVGSKVKVIVIKET